MYLSILKKDFTTSDSIQELVLNFSIYFQEYHRSIVNKISTSNNNNLSLISKQLNSIYYLVKLYRSEINRTNDITNQIKIIISNLSNKKFNLKDKHDIDYLLETTNSLIDLIAYTYDKDHIEPHPCVVPSCHQEAIASHTISKANNFTKGVDFYRLKEKNRLDPSYNVNCDPSLNYELVRVSDKKASAYPLFCEKHDLKIFLPIENGKEIDPSSQKHLYLQNWRTFTLHHAKTKEKKEAFMLNMFNSSDKQFEASKIRNLNLTDYMNSIDGQIYRNQTPVVEILSMSFQLKNNPSILASVILDIKYIAPEFTRNQNPFFNEAENFFYIHILPNGNKPIVNISAFYNDLNFKAMRYLFSLYNTNQQIFWNKIIQFISTSSNVFFNGNIIYIEKDKAKNTVNPTYNKLESLYSLILYHHRNTTDISKSNFPLLPPNKDLTHLIFNKREINFLFAHTSLICNFHD